MVRDRESVIVRLRPRRALDGIPHLVVGMVALWWLAAELEVASGGGPGLILLMFTATFGAVVGWLLLALVRSVDPVLAPENGTPEEVFALARALDAILS